MTLDIQTPRECTTVRSDESGRVTPLVPQESATYTGAMKIFWVGVSAQRDRRGGQAPPLTGAAPTGVIVDQIISECASNLTHEKLNLIDRVLLDRDGRLRPPNKQELTEGLNRMTRVMRENKRCLFIFLGNHIRTRFQAAERDIILDLYTAYDICDARAVFIPHPSYVRVYQYKRLGDYTTKVAKLVANLAF